MANFPGIGRLSTRDLQHLEKLAEQIPMPIDCLAATMSRESGFRTDIVNSIGCVGLIQFCPQTQKLYNVTGDQLASMSFVEQLPYVLKFYRGKRTKYDDCGDVYLSTFYPAALGKPDDFPIGIRGDKKANGEESWAGKVYRLNEPLDFNEDGVITPVDVRDVMNRWIAQFSGKPRVEIPEGLESNIPMPPAAGPDTGGGILVPLLIGAAILWMFNR